VQAAVGVRLAAPNAACTLVAPVGIDFDAALLDGLREEYCVQACVDALAHVPTTPGETIWYEGETMRWDKHGWEGWTELCAWQPVLHPGRRVPHHVEGGGDGEVRAAQAALVAAAARGEKRPWLSIEPDMHEVTVEAVASLASLTAQADLCSPDLHTACRMAALTIADTEAFGCAEEAAVIEAAMAAVEAAVAAEAAEAAKAAAEAEEAGAEAPHAPAASAASADADDTGALSRDALGLVARRCALVLRLRASATLAIRDGAHGSLLLHDGEITRIPAVAVAVTDPTGAGNAYAGALCALLAGDRSPREAAAVASAVGAAFCRSEGWPSAAEAVWVAARAAEMPSEEPGELNRGLAKIPF